MCYFSEVDFTVVMQVTARVFKIAHLRTGRINTAKADDMRSIPSLQSHETVSKQVYGPSVAYNMSIAEDLSGRRKCLADEVID